MNDKPSRRSFLGQAGAALAAPFAATAAYAGERDGASYVAGRLAALEDANALRALQQRYARLVGGGRDEAIAALFADPASALVPEHVRSVVIDGDDTIAISGARTATSRVPCVVTTVTPIESCDTLVEMARLQGDGVVKRSERRVLAGTFVKKDGIWRFERAMFEVAT